MHGPERFVGNVLGLIMVMLPGPTLIAVTLLFVLLLGIMTIAMFLLVKERRSGTFLLCRGWSAYC
jgi:hypothetical protein